MDTHHQLLQQVMAIPALGAQVISYLGIHDVLRWTCCSRYWQKLLSLSGRSSDDDNFFVKEIQLLQDWEILDILGYSQEIKHKVLDSIRRHPEQSRVLLRISNDDPVVLGNRPLDYFVDKDRYPVHAFGGGFNFETDHLQNKFNNVDSYYEYNEDVHEDEDSKVKVGRDEEKDNMTENNNNHDRPDNNLVVTRVDDQEHQGKLGFYLENVIHDKENNFLENHHGEDDSNSSNDNGQSIPSCHSQFCQRQTSQRRFFFVQQEDDGKWDECSADLTTDEVSSSFFSSRVQPTPRRRAHCGHCMNSCSIYTRLRFCAQNCPGNGLGECYAYHDSSQHDGDDADDDYNSSEEPPYNQPDNEWEDGEDSDSNDDVLREVDGWNVHDNEFWIDLHYGEPYENFQVRLVGVGPRGRSL